MAKKKSFKENLVNSVKVFLDNDIVKRAAKTAVQAFVAVLVLTDNPVSKKALVAAGAAALSALWNSVKEYAK